MDKLAIGRQSLISGVSCLSLALAGLIAMPAAAQSASEVAVDAQSDQVKTPVTAADEQAENERQIPTSGNQEDIVVSGRRTIAGGLMKRQTAATAMSSVTPAAISEKLAVASPLQIANTLPGANFGSSDAYGLSIRNFLSIRGLDQTQIGFLIDGAPGVSVANYYPYSEAWADNENISDITITPGNSRLQDPIINASGGEFIESIRDPRDQFGGKVSGSVGSFGGWRGFAGIDTGYLGNSGIKAFASYSHATAENFVGPGRNRKNHVDFRVQKDWSDSSRSTFFVSYDQLYNSRLPILNRVQAIDGIKNDRLEAYSFSENYVPGVTVQYAPLNAGRVKNLLITNNNEISLSSDVTLHVTPYYKWNDTNAPSQSRLSATTLFAGNRRVTPAIDPSLLQNGFIVAAANTAYNHYSAGVNSYVDAKLSSSNTLSVGYWFQRTSLDYRQFLQPVDQQGNIRGLGAETALRATDGTLITGVNDTIKTTTHQLFVGDTQTFLDGRLALTLGFKQLFWKANVENYVIGAPPEVRASWSRFMPRFLASFKIDENNQLYGNVTTNARMPLPQATYITQYSVSTGNTTAVGNTGIKPEYTTSAQIGYRYDGFIHLDVAAFLMKLKDHQVQGTQFVNGFLQTTALVAGDETIKGVSVEASTRSYYGFSLYGNAQYLDAKFDDDLPLRGDVLPIAGKDMVLSPRWIANLGGRFESGGFYASLTYKYVGRQFSTFINDETIPRFQTFDAAMGYKLPDIGALKSPVIRFTVTNIGNKPYISTLAAPQPNAVATRGVNGTLLPGVAPTYYVGATRAALLTLSTDF